MKKHLSSNPIFQIILIISCTVLFSFTKTSTTSKVGEKVSDFKLNNITGQLYSLSSNKEAKGFIVTFICNHCPCSGKYESRIIALDKKYSALGYPVIAINPMDPEKYPTESLQLMKARASMKKYTFPYLADPDKKTAIEYGAACTPYTCVIQKSGADFILTYEGAIDDNMNHPNLVKSKYVQTAVDELLDGKKVSVASTHSFGCSLYH